MRVLTKKMLSCFLALAVIASTVPSDFTFRLEKQVIAAETPSSITKNASAYADDYVVDANIVPDVDLLKALNKIIKGSENGKLTFKELKEYSGSIDLGNFTNISNITGVGYAYSATSFDLSKLTKVKSIPDYEFYECKATKTIKLPGSIINIGKEAFEECVSMEVCDIPSSVVTIDRQAFYACKMLKSVIIPNNIKKIGNQAFAYCESIVSVTIPDGIDAATTESGDDNLANGMGTEVFAFCKKLSSVAIGKGMTTIPAGTFSSNESLKSINIPNNVTTIRDAAFKGSGLTSVDISNLTGLTEINDYVFAFCEKLSSVKLPSGVKRVGVSAFRETLLLSTAFLEDCTSLQTIDANAFSHNSLLLEAIIPSSVEEIGSAAFLDTPILTQVTIKDFPKDIKETKVKHICTNAFKMSYKIKEDLSYKLNVSLPTANENNKYVSIVIDDSAFYGRDTLEHINFPKNITKIGNYAFKECGYETVVDRHQIKRGVESFDLSQNNGVELGIGVFSGCVNLKTVKLPDTITEIPNETFSGCAYKIYDEGQGKYLSQILEDASTSANESAEWYVGLTNVTFSSEVTSFGDDCFKECYKLELPNGIPNSTRYIGKSAFEGCERINSIILPSVLEYIGEAAFSRTSRVSAKGEMSGMKKWGLINVDASSANKIEYIGRNAFRTSAVRKIIFNTEAPVKIVNSYAFYDCQWLEDLTLPKGVGYVDSYSFARCLKLRSLVISDKTTISSSACQGSLDITETDLQYLHYVLKNGYVAESYNANCYIYIMGSSNSYRFYTNDFMITTTPTQDEITIAENSEVDFPFYNIDLKSTNSKVTDVNIDGVEYKWDENAKVFKNINDSRYLFVKQQEINNRVEPGKYESSPKNVPVFGLKTKGLKENKNIKFIMQESLVFKIDNYCPRELVMTPSVQYKVVVTKNPCTEIKTDDEIYISYGSTKTNKIEPVFVAESEVLGEITDVVSWEVISGADLITLTPSGKTATIVSNNLNYGTATVRITAGSIVKDVYVNICAVSNQVTMSSSTQNILVGKNVTLTATLGYDSTNKPISLNYPDKLVITSSDELVAVVKDVVVNGNETTFVVENKIPGTAVITATSMSTGRSARCNIYVGATDTKVTLKDSYGENVSDESDVTLRNRVNATYTYDFSDTAVSTELSYVVEDSSVAKVSISKYNKTITISGLKHGMTKVTFYPTIGNPQQNGFSINLNVVGDVSTIRLNSVVMNVGDTNDTLYQVINTFGDSVYNLDNLSRITDNKLVFSSDSPSVVSVDQKGVVTGLTNTGNSSAVIRCISYNGNVQTASTLTNVVVEKKNQITTSSSGESTTEANTALPEVPKGVSVTIASTTSIYVQVDTNPNGQLNYIYVDNKYAGSFVGGVFEVKKLSKGIHTVYLIGVLDGNASEKTKTFSIEVGSEPTTQPPVTTQPPQTTTKPIETTTQPPVTTQPETTTKPPVTTQKPPVTTQKPPVTTKKTPVTTKPNVPASTIKSVTRTKDNKKMKVT
ncbi:MAG: leucine-rich repeat domain-containing protein, partial [Lachnospiraceae bacterium]|nr:leucine-rich repeat domain-containing protein [Lachnospiraceae bacterium]